MQRDIPEDRIHSSRFPSTPQFGTLSGKVKSHRVENQMHITVESEVEFQTVAAQIDSRPEMTRQGLEAIGSKESDNKAADQLQACEAVSRKKTAVEQSFKVKLAPARLAEGSAG